MTFFPGFIFFISVPFCFFVHAAFLSASPPPETRFENLKRSAKLTVRLPFLFRLAYVSLSKK